MLSSLEFAMTRLPSPASSTAAAPAAEEPRSDGAFCPIVRRKPKPHKQIASSPFGEIKTNSLLAAPSHPAMTKSSAAAASAPSSARPTIDHALVISNHLNGKIAKWSEFIGDIRCGHQRMSFEFSLKGTSYETGSIVRWAQRANGEFVKRTQKDTGPMCRFRLFFPRVLPNSLMLDWSHLVRIEETKHKGRRLVAATRLPRGTMFPYFGKSFPKSSAHEGVYVLASGDRLIDGDPAFDLYGSFAASRINEPSANEISNCHGVDFLLQSRGEDYLFTAIVVVSPVREGQELLWNYGTSYERTYLAGPRPLAQDEVHNLTFETEPCSLWGDSAIGEQIQRWYDAVQSFGIRED